MKTILVATDFSPAATNAVNYALGLIQFFKTKLVLVNVYQMPLGGYDSLQPLEMISALEDASNASLNQLKRELIQKLGYDPGIECVSGSAPLSALIKENCSKYSVDLMVMGMTGEAGKLKEHLIGSTAVDVAKGIAIPLFIVPETCSYQDVKKIAYASDYVQVEENVLQSVNYFCSSFCAELEIVHVHNSNESGEYTQLLAEAQFAQYFGAIKHKLISIQDKNVSEAIRVYLQLNKPDVLIINPKKHDVFEKIFHKSVTKKLAFHSSIPVLSIH